MADPGFLLVRLGSLGDVVHALPAASALRDAFPAARIDWLIDAKWKRLLDGNADLTEAIVLNRSSAQNVSAAVGRLRSAKYACAIDFQALYKSALLTRASGAPRRIGFTSAYAREGLAAYLYTDRLNPRGPHKVDHNLTLVAAAGARLGCPRFPLSIHREDQEIATRLLTAHEVADFFVLNPGGGWRSKCWPPERYGALHQRLSAEFGWRGIVSYGPGEEELAKAVIAAAGNPAPLAVAFGLGPLLALLARAKFMVSADTGPLHLASAIGSRTIGLYGPTDPSRNGPYSGNDVVVRNPRFSQANYQRSASYSPAMLSITVDQVVDAVHRRLRGRG
jgi:ADP-heptose:LPS heptosyltransferase